MFKIIKALFFFLYPVFGKESGIVGISEIKNFLGLEAYYYASHGTPSVEHLTVTRGHKLILDIQSPSISELIEGYKAKE